MARKQNSFGDPRVRVRADGTVSASPDLDERYKAKVAESSAYAKYKQSLHEFFDGKRPLPEKVQQMLDGDDNVPQKKPSAKKKSAPSPAKKSRRRVAQRSADNRALLEAVRTARSPQEVIATVDALKDAGYVLPLDGGVLSKALGHTDEEVIAEALRGLMSLEDNVRPNALLLRTCIENVELLASNTEVLELCAALKAQL